MNDHRHYASEVDGAASERDVADVQRTADELRSDMQDAELKIRNLEGELRGAEQEIRELRAQMQEAHQDLHERIGALEAMTPARQAAQPEADHARADLAASGYAEKLERLMLQYRAGLTRRVEDAIEAVLSGKPA